MSAQVEDGLRKMFGAYGKKPFKQQWDVYLDWTEKIQVKTVLQVIDKVILNEKRLPVIAKLQKEAYAIESKKRKKLLADYEDCWYCQGTGFIPVLYKPVEFSSIYYIRHMACKCKVGEIHAHKIEKIKETPQYFQCFKNLQFAEEKELHPDMNYPQIVDKIKNQLNKNLVDE